MPNDIIPLTQETKTHHSHLYDKLITGVTNFYKNVKTEVNSSLVTSHQDSAFRFQTSLMNLRKYVVVVLLYNFLKIF